MAEFEAVLNPAAEHRLEEEHSQRILRSQAGHSADDGDEIETPGDEEQSGGDSRP